ncbi:MAG: hypothetical protein CMN76_15150 [Spirochaetaceae bacterium]|nr:hypothetical protein [Spirochaetaceae bacterium]
MSSREKILILIVALGGFLFVHFRLALSATGDHDYLKPFERPRAFSRYSAVWKGVYPGLIPEHAFDGMENTCLRMPLTAADFQKSPGLPPGQTGDASTGPDTSRQPDTVPDYLYPTVTGELGLSHGAGDPPSVEDFSFLELKLCDSDSSVRPVAVKVQFFRQKLYDVDRQYRVPDPAEHWKTYRFRLDRNATQRFDLDLEPFAPSRGFPDEFYNVWVRLIFELPAQPGRRQTTSEICIRDVQVGNRAFFHSARGPGAGNNQENDENACP